MDTWMSLRVTSFGICMSPNNMSILSIGNIGGYFFYMGEITMNIIGCSPYELKYDVFNTFVINAISCFINRHK